MSRGLFVLCCLLLACDRAATKPKPAPAPPPQPAPEPAPEPLAVFPGVAELEGELRGEGSALKALDALPRENELSLAAGGSALIALDEHRHVALTGPTSFYLFEEGTVALIEGGARLAVSHAAAREAPLRVVTAHATLNLGPGSEAWVQVVPALGSYVAVLGGSARLTSGTAAAEGGPRSLVLSSGTATFATRELPETSETAPSTLAEAQAEAQTRLRAAVALEPPLDDGGADLEATLSAIGAAQAAGQKRAAEQRKAKQAGKDAKADKLRQELVEQARKLHHLRELAIVRFERFRVRALHLRDATGPKRFAPFDAVAAQLLAHEAQAVPP